MAVVSIFAVLAFDTILCFIEIPKMLNQKLFKELITFSVLLLIGTVMAVMKSLNIDVPNPSDFLIWVFSPFSDLMKYMVQP